MEFPNVEQLTNFVKTYDKRVGLRKIYRDFKIKSEDDKAKLRQLWDAFYARIPDAYGKDEENASRIRETTQNDGDSGPSAGETVQEEPEGFEDGQKETA